MSQFAIIGTPLYQWETGRKLKVVPLRGMSIDSVHFSNYGDTTALVVKPKEENGAFIADIPNVLLQDDQNIVVYSVNVSEDKTETIRECVFPVRKRAKPSNYIYTETEVLTYKALEEGVKKLEEEGTGGVDEGQVKEAIKDYLIENPIEESDPTVPDWATQPQKPTYTAKEVGAIPKGGDPSASVDFQEVHTEIVRADELTITAGDEGEKSISMWYGGKTADGNGRVVDVVDENHGRPGTIIRGIADPEQEDDTVNKRYVDRVIADARIRVSGAVPGQILKVAEVDKNGVPTAWETADLPVGGGAWRQIADLDIAEDCTRVVITEDTDGKPFKATAYYILLKSAIPADETWTDVRRIVVAPWTVQQAIDAGVPNLMGSVWSCGLAGINAGITNKATSVTSSSAYIAVGKGMAYAHLWESYNNGSMSDSLSPSVSRSSVYHYSSSHAELVLKTPYSDALQFDGNNNCFSAGSKLKIWAIDYTGEE